MEKLMIPVIISGGSGTRLWPLSRNSLPKQFCEIFDESLITQTYKRLKPLGNPYILTVENFKALSLKFLSPLGLKEHQLILEPFGRNTAPAIALLCEELLRQGLEDEVVGVFPADHFILETENFQNCVRAAAHIAMSEQVVTIGIEPTAPSTGYGYIELDKSKQIQAANSIAYLALGFREKPSRQVAEKFIADKKFLWNAGMFVFQIKHMISLFEKHQLELWGQIKKIGPENLNETYQKIKPTSIDYGIMEKLDSHICIPSNFQWSDVGSWDSLVELLYGLKPVSSPLKKDFFQTHSDGNVHMGSSERIVGFVGVKNLIVVNTDDATLIATKGSTEKVKDLLDQIQNSKIKSQHNFEIRPWGKFEILKETPDFKSKIITVDPGGKHSYQSHTQREEHWTIVKGVGEVILDGKTISISKGSSIFIPIGCKHRILNTGSEALIFIEVQLGTYFGEDDITRYNDDYGRT
jgi:mannose-1-phosphate guanylyltransferase/mannose-1-phosphate guanylyltransferase/mannose-6-phosphate isomerase